MHIIRTAEALARLHATPELKALLRAQAARLEEYGPLEDLAEILIVGPGDTPEEIDAALGWALLEGGTFAKPVELINLRGGWYEVVFILSDDGFGLILYVPDQEGTNHELLTACRGAAQ